MDLLIARNPDPDSSLPYLLRVPLDEGVLVFRTKGTWPRTGALYCHPVPEDEWPTGPEIVERVALRSCRRRGAAIDVIADRGREQRSQIVFTRARGRETVFWQSPRTRKQARPNVRTPTARAAGVTELEIVVDAHERYPYTFSGQQVTTRRQGLRCGDYAITDPQDGRVVAAVERKSLADLVNSLQAGRLRYAVAELAALPRAAVVVEDRFSQLFALEHARPAAVADDLAALQIAYPAVPLVFCETRKLAQEWTYRYLAAAHQWAGTDSAARDRAGLSAPDDMRAPGAAVPTGSGAADTGGEPAATGETPEASSAQIREWARARGLEVSDRGRLRADVLRAWRRAHSG
ncbi:histone-like nucleoid-structuring protein Lsr2 [Pseudonocardia nantongensis]|uniref:ERCC4 domain-containing protein n=1 Tax=Pseudonocardia nantongensis TaxID=1181885 RepID=UPI003979B189